MTVDKVFNMVEKAYINGDINHIGYRMRKLMGRDSYSTYFMNTIDDLNNKYFALSIKALTHYDSE